MFSCDLDGPEIYKAVDVTARKQHLCCECGCPIMPGEKYVRCSGKWDGHFSVYCQHADCCDACMAIRDASGECLCFGELLEYYHECDRRFCDANLRGLFAKILRRRRGNRAA
jgi:hypothetical protein